MASMTGWLWSRAAAIAVARGIVWKMPNDECMTKLECPTRDIRVIRGSSVVEATRLDWLSRFCENLCGSWQLTQRTANGATLFGVFSSSATSSPFSQEPGAN